MIITKLFPDNHFVIHSALDADALRKRLLENVEEIKYMRNPFSEGHKTFQGAVMGSQFEIYRVIHYRNHFLPMVNGEIKGSTVDINMKLHRKIATGFPILALVVMLGFIANFFLFPGDNSARIAIFIVVPIFLLLIVLLRGLYRYEIDKQKALLVKIFSGTIKESK